MNTRTLFATATSLFLVAGIALAQENTITFPVAELGGCESKEACHAYCENPANHEACISFAEAHGLMSEEEIAIARKIGTQTGPGGCVGLQCKAYCDSEEY